MVTASPREESGHCYSKKGEWSLLVQEGRVASPRGESGHC